LIQVQKIEPIKYKAIREVSLVSICIIPRTSTLRSCVLSVSFKYYSATCI